MLQHINQVATFQDKKGRSHWILGFHLPENTCKFSCNLQWAEFLPYGFYLHGPDPAPAANEPPCALKQGQFQL